MTKLLTPFTLPLRPAVWRRRVSPAAIASVGAVCAMACTAAVAAEGSAAAPAQAPTEGASCVEVEVLNVRPAQGQLLMTAFDREDQFGKQPLSRMRVAAGEATTRFRWCGLQAESVAVMMFQDLDGDGRMGRNLVGMPTEPWGSSGTPGGMGPRWDIARVPLDGRVLVLTLVK